MAGGIPLTVQDLSADKPACGSCSPVQTHMHTPFLLQYNDAAALMSAAFTFSLMIWPPYSLIVMVDVISY